jgi:hypothetical protein
MQILVLEVNSSITLFNLNEINGNLTFEKIKEIDNPKFLDYVGDTECIILDSSAPDEPKLSVVLSNLISSNYKVTTNNVTNAIKKINNQGQIVEHLNREEYVRLCTPVKSNIELIKSYFEKYAEWNLNKFLLENETYYDKYQALEPEVYLESK